MPGAAGADGATHEATVVTLTSGKPNASTKDDGIPNAVPSAMDAAEPAGSAGGARGGGWRFWRRGDTPPTAKPEAPHFDRGQPPRFLRRPLTYISFEWFTTLLWHGRRHTVQYDHLFELPRELRTEPVFPPFDAEFKRQHEKAKATEKGRAALEKARESAGSGRVLLRTIAKQHRWRVLAALLMQVAYAGINFTGPILLNQIISYLNNSYTGAEGGVTRTEAYIFAMLMFIFPILGSIIATHSNRLSLTVQMKIRAELAASIYRKAMRLSSQAKQNTETGKVVNLMSADINQIMTFFYPFFSQLVTAPLIIIGATIFLFTQISWATLVGLFILVLSTPASGYFVKRLTQLRREMLKYTDQRVKLMNQLLVGVRVLKMYAWEAAQEAAVLQARRSELKELRRCIPMRVGMQTLLFAAPTIAAVASFLVFGAMDPNGFTAQAIFTSIALFNLMRFPLIMVPFALVQLGNAIVSMRRISHFMLQDERTEGAEPMDEPGIKVEHATFFWAEQKANAVEVADKAKADAKADAKALKRAKTTTKENLRKLLAEKEAQGAAGKPPLGKQPSRLRRMLSRKPKADADAAGADAAAAAAADDVAVVPKEDTSREKAEAAGAATAVDVGSMGEEVPRGSAEAGERAAADVALVRHDSSLSIAAADGPRGGSSSSSTDLAVSADVQQGIAAASDDKRGADGEPVAAAGDAAAAGGGRSGAQSDGRFVLQDIDLHVAPGELVAVVGRVGSGKSSLISAILGEMQRSGGAVFQGGRMAYVAQQAWIINDTLLNNVLFSSEYDEARWDTCLEACCLASDLAMLPGGAHTEIGEKGINLSGGQKQRVSLARATYQDADVYIMDDPLSAVDVHVGRHIFEYCINGVLAEKTRLLVTNQLQYLEVADRVVFMEEGRIAVQGSFEECLGHPVFQRMVSEYNAQAGQKSDGEEEGEEEVVGALRAGSAPLFDEMDKAAGVDRSRVVPVKASIERSDTRTIMSAAANDALALSSTNSRAGPVARNTSSMRGFTLRTKSGEAPEPVGPAQVPEPTSKLLMRVGEARASAELRRTSMDRPPQRYSVDSLRSARTPSAPLDKALQLEAEAEAARQRPPKDGVEAAKRVFVAEAAEAKRSRSGEVARGSLDGGKGAAVRSAKEDKAAADAAATSKGKLVVKEDQGEGQIGAKVYWYYIKAFHEAAFLALLIIWSCEQSLRVLTNWWLSQWTNAEITRQINEAAGAPSSSILGKYMGVYVALAACFVFATFLRSLNNLAAALRASRQVHASSLHHLVRAPTTFFDTTPVGRVLNRFSKDTDEMDFMLPQSISEFGNCVFQLSATLVFITIVQYWFIVGIIPLFTFYFAVQHYYRKSYIELQRLDAVSRSPIYAHFSETLSGIETIRAYGMVDRFALNNDVKVDYNHRAYFNLKIADEWLSMRLDLVGASITFTAAILAVYYAGQKNVGLLALTLTESLEVTAFLKYLVRAAAMFESRFNAIERLMAYTLLPQEAPKVIEDKSPPPSWPSEGVLEYRDVWMRYRPELDPVLKGVSFRVDAGDKVGIVGRTGSGKSSLVVTLFRLVEPYKGSIVLDDVDILELGLDDVRGRIAAIPQDPVLFSGTLRVNLDPFTRHKDEELWDALGHVALKEVVSGLPGALAARVSENGDNFSVGQRQLLCVARALLRRPRVLVADEATASVDSETDALIQRTIRANFAACTVLTIAHRLNTIMDSTKVLVMDAGRVQEYDTVPRLLSRNDSSFRGMAADAGLLEEAAGSHRDA